MNMIFLTSALFYLIVGLLVLGTIFIFVKIYKNEKNRKKYQEVMKVGDKVSIPVNRTSLEGIITKIEGDDVEVSVNFKKWRVYPNGNV